MPVFKLLTIKKREKSAFQNVLYLEIGLCENVKNIQRLI